MLSALSGLRRNDGSLVPVQGTPFKGETFNQVPEQYREGFADFMRNNPKYRIGGQAISYATLPDGNRIQFGDTAGASGFREYLKTLNTPNGTGTQMPIGGTPLPEGVQIGYGPIKGGLFNNDGTNFTGDNPLLRPGLGPRDSNFYPSRPEMNTSPLERAPIDNTGIGSLTQNPINTTPESSITGSIGSPYLNNNQDLDQYLNSYVENLINRRMRDIFGGIMSIFQ